MLELRGYQERSLRALERYLRAVPEQGAKVAFIAQTDRPHHAAPQLPGLPYVCLRVPTGGGKTLMACHALGMAARELLQAEHAVCLWLVPSNAILDQTLSALRDRAHPYRQALDAAFGGQVTPLSLGEALYVTRATLEGSTTVVVSTLAALRVEDTEGRKVYEAAGALAHHFSALDDRLAEGLERAEGGTIIPSLANVLRLWSPVVIVDEAHNARTPLSFDTLARFNPSCVIEFTATPQLQHAPEHGEFASNVLHHVSAAELKAEEMIKLPVRLETHSDWKEVVGRAVETQRELEQLAIKEGRLTGEYIRPMVLLQAQPKREGHSTLTVEVVKQCLLEDHKLPVEQVTEATGEKRGLDGVDVLSRDCPLRFVITVQALKEGWDCPFAYVLCSVADIHSPRAVEQILGRVLRMPHARRKQHEGLNVAYAFAASAHFAHAASSLYDALVESGFQRLEARDFITPGHTAELPFGPIRPDELPMGEATQRRPGEPFRVPQLAIRVQGVLEAFEDTHFLDAPWDLADCDPALPEDLFAATPPPGTAAQVDVDDTGRMQVQFIQQVQWRQTLLARDTTLTKASLATWLDKAIRHPDVPRDQSSLFIHRVIETLMHERGFDLAQLGRRKYQLRQAIGALIDRHRTAFHRAAFNQLLFEAPDAIEVSPEVCFSFQPGDYSPNWYYEGPYDFGKRWYPLVGELKSEGEEFDCAVYIDALPEVSSWVRNLDRRDRCSFWLQTPTDRFYPDFVARLGDGRFLVVEYKGAHLWSNDDSKEKRAIGELWAARSNGTCLFVMPKGPDWQAIAAAVRG